VQNRKGKFVNTVFDFIEALNKKINEHLGRGGNIPVSVAISRRLYRRLMEMRSAESTIGNLVIGSSPVSEIQTAWGKLAVYIDEMLSDVDVEIA
jgi:hypothetical protein